MQKLAAVFGTVALWAHAGLADEPTKPQIPSFSQTAPAPFAFADFSWVPGNYAPAGSGFSSKYFTPELRLDVAYHHSFNNPADDTISGSSEVFRHGEFQITQIGIGGDFQYNNVGFRLMTQFGLYSTATPRNDPSPTRGQWQLDNAYRYISEAYGTYHIDTLNGINVQAGLFMSYIGLWSYYCFDNWTYQPSYVSSNTPWYFNGARVQFYTSDKFKIEPWLINGWQSYGKFNNAPGLGFQALWRPAGDWSFVSNNYYGKDTLNTPDRKRYHTDDSLMYKYKDAPDETISKAAASLTIDAGCESGGGVGCDNQYFLGFMAYNRFWFNHDKLGLTIGGGGINNPGRYLVIVPPINGATAATGAAPFFTANPGDQYHAWDMQISTQWMPNRNITFLLEFNHRHADIPYFTGAGGVSTGGAPDLVTFENRLTGAFMVRM